MALIRSYFITWILGTKGKLCDSPSHSPLPSHLMAKWPLPTKIPSPRSKRGYPGARNIWDPSNLKPALGRTMPGLDRILPGVLECIESINIYKYTFAFIYIDGSHSVGRINCSLVTPVSRQTQSDGVISDVYFNVAMILSNWSRHQIINLTLASTTFFGNLTDLENQVQDVV